MSSLNFSLDYTKGKIAHRLSHDRWRHEPLLKLMGATKVDKPSVIDMTAGLCFDALLAAQAGCQVTAYEQQPALYLILRKALQDATACPWLQEAISRLTLIEADAVTALHPDTADIILCDPMFGEKNKHAKTGGEMALLQANIPPPTHADEQAMLEAARQAATKKVIVKRPRKAPSLADVAPQYTQQHKSCRFDVYLPCPK